MRESDVEGGVDGFFSIKSSGNIYIEGAASAVMTAKTKGKVIFPASELLGKDGKVGSERECAGRERKFFGKCLSEGSISAFFFHFNPFYRRLVTERRGWDIRISL